MTPKRRGRPPKAVAPLTIVGDMLSPETAAELRRRLLLISDLASLQEPERGQLLQRVEHALPWYDVIQKARRRGPKAPGRRYKSEIPVLLVACMRAWVEASGRNASLWEDRDGSGGEATAVTLTREALGVALGLTSAYQGSLRRQIEIAKKAWADDFKKK